MHAGKYRERINSIVMNTAEVPSLGIRRLVFSVVLTVAVWWLPAIAQTQPDQPAQVPTTQEPTKPASPPEELPGGDVKITPRQAEELFHSVDEILAFDSKQTGLPIKKEVKRRLTSRDEVVAFLTKHMDDEDTKRLKRSEWVLKRFALLPRDFKLETFLGPLRRE